MTYLVLPDTLLSAAVPKQLNLIISMRRSILTPFRMGYTVRISYPKVHLILAKYEEVPDYSYSTLFIFEDLVNVAVFACFVYITKNI